MEIVLHSWPNLYVFCMRESNDGSSGLAVTGLSNESNRLACRINRRIGSAWCIVLRVLSTVLRLRCTQSTRSRCTGAIWMAWGDPFEAQDQQQPTVYFFIFPTLVLWPLKTNLHATEGTHAPQGFASDTTTLLATKGACIQLTCSCFSLWGSLTVYLWGSLAGQRSKEGGIELSTGLDLQVNFVDHSILQWQWKSRKVDHASSRFIGPVKQHGLPLGLHLTVKLKGKNYGPRYTLVVRWLLPLFERWKLSLLFLLLFEWWGLTLPILFSTVAQLEATLSVLLVDLIVNLEGWDSTGNMGGGLVYFVGCIHCLAMRIWASLWVVLAFGSVIDAESRW